MNRLLAGGAITLLLTTGAFLFWQGQAADRPSLPAAPTEQRASASSGRLFTTAAAAPSLPDAPEASVRNRAEQRFWRADKDKDGKITSEEVLAPRRKAFAKLDVNGNGTLSFDEWATKSIGKFASADDDKSGWLSAVEYAETAPKVRPRTRCSC